MRRVYIISVTFNKRVGCVMKKTKLVKRIKYLVIVIILLQLHKCGVNKAIEKNNIAILEQIEVCKIKIESLNVVVSEVK